MGLVVPLRVTTRLLRSNNRFSAIAASKLKGIIFCNGVGGSWGAGSKNVRAIRFFGKPPPPWGSLVMNPRNIATVEKIIPETNILAELAAPGAGLPTVD